MYGILTAREKCLQNQRFCNRGNLRFSYVMHFSTHKKSLISHDFEDC